MTDRPDASGFFLRVSVFVVYMVSCAAFLSADYTPDRETFSKWDKKKLLYKTGVETDSSMEMLKLIGLNWGPRGAYVTCIAANPGSKYLYYVISGHGRGFEWGAPVIQYDTATRTKKVLAFLHPSAVFILNTASDTIIFD